MKLSDECQTMMSLLEVIRNLDSNILSGDSDLEKRGLNLPNIKYYYKTSQLRNLIYWKILIVSKQ